MFYYGLICDIQMKEYIFETFQADQIKSSENYRLNNYVVTYQGCQNLFKFAKLWEM